MTLLETLRRALGAFPTPWSGAKRKRGPEEGAQEAAPAAKRQAAPGSTKKALQFSQEDECPPSAADAGGAAAAPAVCAPVLQPQKTTCASVPVQQAPPAQRQQQPPTGSVPPRLLGQQLVQQATQRRTAYNSPQLPSSKRHLLWATAGLTPLAVTPLPTPNPHSFVGAAAGATQLQPRDRGAQHLPQPSAAGTRLKPAGHSVLFGQVQGPAPGFSAQRQQPQPHAAVTGSRFLAVHAPAVAAQPAAMGQPLGKPGEPKVYDHKSKELLKRMVGKAHELEEEHRRHVAKPSRVETVDLTEEEVPTDHQRQQQAAAAPTGEPGPSRLPGRSGAAAGPAAAAGPDFAATPGGRLPFTPGLLATAARLRFEGQHPIAAASPPDSAAQLGFTPSLLRSHEAHPGEDAYRKVQAEWDEARQAAEAKNIASLAVARKVHTALDQRRQEMQRWTERQMWELRQLEEQMQQRQTARGAASAKQALPEAREPVHAAKEAKAAAAEEEEVVELLSSDDEAAPLQVLEESSSAAAAGQSASESEVSQQLTELSVSEALPQLTDAHYDVYSDATRTDGNLLEVLGQLHPRSQIEIRRKDITCMRPLEWLNDEVINLYMSLLQERDMRRRAVGLGPKCHFFSTFFINKLYKDTGYCYKDVARWTLPRRLKATGQLCESVLDCDRVIMPVHQGMHWVCAVVDLANKQLIYYDSLKGEDHQCLDHLAKWVADEAKAKRQQELDTSSWDRVFPKNIPHQQNGSDCGVFTLLFADFAARNARMAFGQKDIQAFRVKIVNDILAQRVD